MFDGEAGRLRESAGTSDRPLPERHSQPHLRSFLLKWVHLTSYWPRLPLNDSTSLLAHLVRWLGRPYGGSIVSHQTRFAFIFVTCCVFLLPHADADPLASGCRLFLLEDRAGTLALQAIDLAEGEKNFELSASTGLVTFAVPLGEGKSADLVQGAAGAARLETRCTAGTLSLRVVKADGRTRELPPVSREEVRRFDLKVHVTAGDGRTQSFLVRAGETVEPGRGPVLDLFAGRIPLGSGDYAVTTETRPAETVAAKSSRGIAGQASLSFDGEHFFTSVELPGGLKGRFVVDLAAGRTVIARRVLPAGATIQPLTSVEYGDGGNKPGGGHAHALSAAAPGLAGTTRLDTLAAGSLRWPEPQVLVMENLPEIGGAAIDGILGIDLLDAGNQLRLEMRQRGSARLSLGETPAATAPGAIEGPFHRAGSHVVAPATVGGHPLGLIVDSGAKVSVLTRALADRLGLRQVSPTEQIELRGLDGRPIQATFFAAARLEIGQGGINNVRFAVVPELPVLRALGVDPDHAILGNNFLARFKVVELDFEAGRLRLVP